MIIYGGDNPYRHDVSVVGGKGLGLYKLIEYGLRVPDFFVIAAGTDITDPDFLHELDEYAQKLGGDVFSVRSSGVSEDGESASFAGQYGTELNVARTGLAEAVYKVYASKDEKSVKAYTKRTDDRPCEMAIIVQRQITGSESGVMFSTSPQEPNVTLIESVRGGGESLVSGAASPDKRRYCRNDSACSYDKELLDAATLLENGEGGPVDVEWSYDGSLWFLQLRRQTVLSDVMPEIEGGKWDLYVFRDFTVFSHSVQECAAQADVQRELFGFCTPITEGVWACGREFYSEKNDAAQIGLWTELDRNGFFDRFETNIKQVVRDTKRRCAIVKNKDYSRISDTALFSAYE
ncbi:MAG: PEP/pyruvate-binding domain-containing protein, partial [Clostridiales bacterium]|nr:PEP/pyruvate-binding domain-containing protein [Clostridiales bacterium]